MKITDPHTETLNVRLLNFAAVWVCVFLLIIALLLLLITANSFEPSP